MNRKKMIGWVVGVPVLVIALMIFIVLHEPVHDGLPRAAAYKAAALLIASQEQLEADEGAREQSHFPAAQKNDWYVKYMDYLYEKGMIDEELTPATAQGAGGLLTYGEVEYLIGQLEPSLQGDVRASRKNRGKAFPADSWWFLYDSLRGELDGEVREEEIRLFGTPLNIDKAPAWTAYTDTGNFRFEGLGMDTYIDSRLKVLVRGREIITVKEVLESSATYRNVWLSPGGGNQFRAHVGEVAREFPMDASLGQPDSFLNNLADLTVKGGKIQKVTLKKERITGKVLSVRDDSIEIEGYGTVKLDADFKVYKVYGEFEPETINDILVGYDIQEFVVAKGKLCAALTVREFDAKSIRVLLMDTNFQTIFHLSVTVSSDVDMTLSHGKEKEVIPAGEEVTITQDDKRLGTGRMVLELSSADGEIKVSSIKRAQGAPAYAGRLEISREPKGLVLVNELYLEDYLVKVVPSEMPESYEKEALKAQAVCARTYAYMQIQGNTYSEYGAHVDDSTRFQVYNNIRTDARTEAAVKETYGKMLFYGDAPIEAYYFSTSCGHTTDGGVWGNDPSLVPYLEGVVLREGRQTMNLTSNSDFEAFIKDWDFPSYDASFPMYRWETTITNTQLAEKIGGVGTILNLSVTERGVGGVAKKVRVEGSEGMKTISGEGQIRDKLGNAALKITKKDGKQLTGWDTLPSAFIHIEADGIDDRNVTTFHIYGGGFGHGAGMSQNGAQGMAREGKTYDEILKFFYSGVEVREPAPAAESGGSAA